MSPGSCGSARTGTKLSRSVAQGFADSLNGVLNRTVSDSRLSVRPITGYLDAFELARVVNEDDVPLDLDGTALRLFVKQVVVIEDGRCRTESYSYRLQTDVSRGSWLMRWEYVREPSEASYVYPSAHVHVNGRFPNDVPIGALHIPTCRVPVGLVVRHLITEWGVKPRGDDWEVILDESVADFDAQT